MSELLASGLEKSYRKRKVVSSLSLSIASGEVVGLLGPNGAGKTTAFYMIVGLVPCDGGRIELDGEDITSLPMHARARRGLGYLPQEPSIFRRMTVVDNVKAILETRSDLDAAARDEALESLLEELHVAHLRDSMGMSLSGGERRRVEIAAGLEDRLHVVHDRHATEDRRFLRQVADALARAHVHRIIGEVHAVERDAPRVRRGETDRHVNGGGLAGAVGAELADDFSRIHREAHASNDGAATVRLGEFVCAESRGHVV